MPATGFPAQTTYLSYDYESRVSGITYQSSATNSFKYNGNDLRVQKVDSGGTHNYITVGTTPASDVISDGSAVYTPGLSENRGGTSAYYHPDALGSTRDITNSSQSVTDTRRFDAFGMLMQTSGSNPTAFGFAGAEQYQTDSDSGLMLLGHRYYDNTSGRFLSRDPAYSGTNWYAYCGNSPLGATDASGLYASDMPMFDDGFGGGGNGGSGGEPLGGHGGGGGGAIAAIIAILTVGGGGAAAGGGAAGGGIAAGGGAVAVGTALIKSTMVVGSDGNLYPPNNGYLAPPHTITLKKGRVIIRYGGEGGTFVTNPGTPPERVSLPPYREGSWLNPPTKYRVAQPIPGVEAGIAAPVDWPGYPGQRGTGYGIQYNLPTSISELVGGGYLEPVM